MLELSISQAQAQFTKLLTQTVTIVDKKAHQKKAVLIPYDTYMELLSKSTDEKELKDGSFNQFIGILDKNFETDDLRYQEIIK